MKDFTVFISYSHDDGRAYAERLNTLLQSVFSDINVFWDKELIAGDYFWDKLLEQVRHCNVFLYLVSDSSTKMPSNCIRELDNAFFYHKHVIPCILPTYSGDPTKIPVTPELDRLQYVDLREGIENAADEIARLYGAIYESIVNSSPTAQLHRREMMLLYEILDKISDDNFENKHLRAGREVYERGFELEYDEYPMIEGRVSRGVCIEVIDILDMMGFLQGAWNGFGEEEKKRVEESVGRPVAYRVKNVGFCGNHETAHLSYMRFLNRDEKFTRLTYASDRGNSHMRNVPKYRAMLSEYSHIKRDDSNDFYKDRYQLSIDEVIQILQAQDGAISHPL